MLIAALFKNQETPQGATTGRVDEYTGKPING